MNKPSMPTTVRPMAAVKRTLSRWSTIREVAIPIVALLLLSIGLLGFRLGSFNSLSPIETKTIAINQFIRHIGGAPINLPYRFISHLSLMSPVGSDALLVRLPSMLVALLAVGLFFLIVRRWHGRRNAILPTLLFATSGWLLHAGRFGSGLIAITATILALIAASTWLSNANEDRDKGRKLLIFSIVVAVTLFIPAGIWFVLAACVVLREDIVAHFRTSPRVRRIASIAVVSLSVLAVTAAILHHPEQIGQWLGIPLQHFPDKQLLLKYAAGSITYLFARGPFMPELWLAHTPLLDIATAGLMLLGLAFYSRRWSSNRVQLLACFLVFAVILITLNGPYALAYMAPLVYLLAATGIVYLLHEWHVVFPRNPIARNLAIVLAVVMVLAATAYHTQRYYLAWHRSPDTRQAYHDHTSAMPLDLLQ